MKKSILVIISHLFILTGVMANEVIVDGKLYPSLGVAAESVADGSIVYLAAGDYKSGIVIKHNDVQIIGEQGVVFDNIALRGKAPIIVHGNNILIENIECKNIAVPDKNGTCIRFHGRNAVFRNIYVHDSESGIMASKGSGKVVIEYSKFERLGTKGKGVGFAHAVYITADEFIFKDNEILEMKKEGSGIKTRSKKAIIENNILATFDSNDSRLIDAANYGELIVKNNIFQQGDNSSNSQVIGYGLEKKVVKKYSVNRIEITDNLFLLDRSRGSILLKQKQADDVIVKNNIIVGPLIEQPKFIHQNLWYKNRDNAKLNLYPYIPKLSELSQVKKSILVFGEQ